MAQAQPPQGTLPGQIAPPAQTDPLANLRDIHIPGAIDPWPPAIGWWLLAAIILIALGFGIFRIFKWWKSNQYRREAIRALTVLLDNHETDKQYLRAYSDLLKRVALSKYPRESVANLTGEAWVSFLDRSARTQEFTMGEGQVLVQGNYEVNPSVNVEQLHKLGLHWIKKHRKLESTKDADEDTQSSADNFAFPSTSAKSNEAAVT